MNLVSLSMEIFLFIWAVIVLAIDLVGVKRKKTLATLSLVGIAIDALLGILLLTGKTAFLQKPGGEFYAGFVYISDPMSLYFKELFCLIAFIVLLISSDFLKYRSLPQGEFYPLMLFITVGMMMMASAGDFLLLFISMELISIPLYVLAALDRGNKASAEAGFKYFVTGAFSSAILLYGISILYGCSGSLVFIKTSAQDMLTILTGSTQGNLNAFSPTFSGALMLGLVFVIAGVCFKLAAAPFHMWSPDVYEGAPLPVTAFISVGPKAAAVAVLMRLFIDGLGDISSGWAPVFAIIAMLSIIVGNLAALRQNNIKRLLAYSGISQMGYLLLGLVGITGDTHLARVSVLFYIAVYSLMNLAAFSVAILCSMYYDSENIQDYRGLSKKSPGLAAIMLIAVLSLAGIPPLAGFIGKFYLFASAYSAFNHRLVIFVLVAIVFSVISLFYYLRILKYMYFTDDETVGPIVIPGSFKVALSITALAILFLGLTPPFHQLVELIAR